MSISKLNKITELNYSNYMIESSTYLGSKPYESYFISTLSDNLDKLDGLRSGYVPSSNASYAL
jgi:hypothetical protein